MTLERNLSSKIGKFLANVKEGRSVDFYRSGETVSSQGAPADTVYFIQSGSVKATVVSRQGKEAVIAIIGAEQFFGEACLAGLRVYEATWTPLEDSIIVRLSKNVIERAIIQDPEFAQIFIQHMVKRNARTEGDLIDQLFNSSERRLARTLLLLANFGQEGVPETVIAKISQQTLADMIGTTRSRVNFFMNKFRDLGYIDYNSRIKVNRSLLNAVLHEQPGILEYVKYRDKLR